MIHNVAVGTATLYKFCVTDNSLLFYSLDFSRKDFPEACSKGFSLNFADYWRFLLKNYSYKEANILTKIEDAIRTAQFVWSGIES